MRARLAGVRPFERRVIASILFEFRTAPLSIAMHGFIKRPDTPFHNNVAAALHKSIVDGTLLTDLQAATAFVEQEIKSRAKQLGPLGLATPILSTKEIKENM